MLTICPAELPAEYFYVGGLKPTSSLGMMGVLSESGWGRQQGVGKRALGNFCRNHCTEEETNALFFPILHHFYTTVSCQFIKKQNSTAYELEGNKTQR